MNSFIRALALASAMALTVPVAMAATKDDVKAQKSEAKVAKKELKAVTKIQKKWSKVADSDKAEKVAKVDESIVEWAKVALAELRDDGVPTKDPAPTHPQHPEDAADDVGKPKLEARRDTLKELRETAASDKAMAKKKTKLLDEVVMDYTKRYERLDAKWRATKESL